CIFCSFSGASDIRQLHWSAVSVRHHQIIVVGSLLYLIVGVDRVSPARAIEIAFRSIDVGIGQGSPQIVDIEAVGSELAVIRLNAHCWALTAADADQPYSR